MAQENSNSTMEMGTSDQVLVSTKKTKPITYIIGFAAMLVAIGIAITLVVVLSGNEGGVAEPIVSTTPVVPTDPTESTMAPTVPITAPSTTAATTVPTTDSTTATAPTTTEIPEIPPPDQIEVEDVINGLYSPASFNGSWSADNRVLFRNSNGDLVLYDVDSLTFTPLIANTSEILQQSSRVTQLSADGSQVLLAYGVAPVYRYSFIARYAAIDLSGNVTEILPPNLARSTDGFLQNVVWGPSGTSLAFVYLNNIFYQSSLDSTPQQITTSGQLNVVYNGIPDWVYEEEVFVSSNAMWFSADGNKLAYVTFNDTNVRIMRVPHYGVPGSVEYQYTRHHEIHYPKPGTTNPTVTVTLRNIVNNEDSVYEAPTDLNEPILKAVRFVTNEAIALLWSDRAQTSMIVQLCGPTSTCTQIYQYNEPNGWIDNIPLLFNREGNSFITILPQAVDGVLYKQIVQVSNVNANSWTATGRTNTAHTVVDILLWTDDDIIWYKATHVNDSAAQHLYSVDSSRSVACFSCNITRTDGQECVYNDATMSSDGTKVTLNCAGPGVPQTFIYDISGSRVLTWDTNEEISTLVDQRSTPTTLRLSFPVADGLPEADVLLHLPSDYEQRTNIPLLVYVYGGPDTALVTKQWSIDWGSSLVARWGVALAHIDARGSGLRGVNNMFAVNRRLGTVEIDDQINVTRQLQQLPWLDSNRTCIWGWSYGGYAASLALARGGDVFRCAAAVAPVVDWRFYDTIYTERYMDTPQNNQVGYSQSSLLSEEVAAAYRNKSYFLIHGTADDNVHYQHAMLFSRLLQRRDVAFTQMSYTDEDHGLVGVRPHLYHALEKFLGENML